MSYVLGIDLGTTYTSAAIVADGRAEVIQLGLRSSVVPTVVFLTEDGQLLTGETASRRAVTAPTRVAREFKRRVGDTAPLLLGGTPMAPQALMARMLRWVIDKVSEERGEPPAHVAVSHPANWGPYKLGLLEQAVRLADLETATMITEPEAAARYYASSNRLTPGDIVAVYDLGGGTFDAAVVEVTSEGMTILGTPEGIEHLGGIDIDEAVFGLVTRALGGALDDLDPDDPLVTAGAARLRRDCVEAKEALSSDDEAIVPVVLPGVQTEVAVTREELEALVRPTLGATIGALQRALRSAQVAPDDLAAVLLVGGTSRMPVVAELVTEALGRRVAVDTHPKHAVSLGTALEAEVAITRERTAGTPVAEIVPPRETPLVPPGDPLPPIVPATPDEVSGRPSRPTLHADTPPPPTPPPIPPPIPPVDVDDAGVGAGPGAGRAGGAGRDPRRLIALGAAVLALVVAGVIVLASRGGDGDGGGSGDAAGPIDSRVAATTVPPVGSTVPPVATTAPPVATTAPPTQTTVPPTETTVPPTETTVPPTETTVPPVDTTIQPTESTVAPVETTVRQVDTTIPPIETAPAGPSAEIAALTVGRRLPVGAFPDGVAVDGAGRIWTASSTADDVSRIDPTTGAQERVAFPAGTKPLAVLTTPLDVYVTLATSNQLARIDPDTLEYDLIDVPDAPSFLAWGDDELLVVGDGGSLHRVDPTTLTVTASIEIPGAKGVAVLGDEAWVTASTANEVVKVDLTTDEVVESFQVGGGPDAIVADGAALWITNRGEGSVVRFDTVYEEVTDRIDVGTAPAAIAIDGDRVWVADSAENTLALVDQVTATVVDSVPVGRQPLGLQPVGDRVWVSSAADDSVVEVVVWTDAPVAPRAEISDVAIVGTRYVPTFTTQNFTPAIGGDLHVHLFWNTSLVTDVGAPGAGPWLVWDQPERVDDPFFDIADRPAGANALCIIVANDAHEIADLDGDGTPDYDTANCAPLPVETTVPPVETTVPPVETTVPPVETTVPPVTTPRAEIVSIELVGTRYIPTFTPQHFTPAVGGDLHVHLYWNTTPIADVGAPGAGPWLVWDLPERVDDPFFDIANQPAGADQVCIIVADTAHQVADLDADGVPDYDSGNCAPLGAEAAASTAVTTEPAVVTTEPTPAADIVWEAPTEGPLASVRGPSLAGDPLPVALVFGSQDGSVYRVSTEDGAVVWQAATPGPIVSSPLVYEDAVFVGAVDGLHKVALADGSVGWHAAQGAAMNSSPATDGTTIYIGSEDTHLYAVDIETGEVRWRTSLGAPVFSSPAVEGGVVYVGSQDGAVWALDAATGAQVWRTPTGGPVFSSPALDDGRVYVGSNDGNLYALDAATGEVDWRFGTAELVSSSPAVEDGVVYVGSFDHHVYAVDARIGGELWRFDTGAIVFSSPVVDGDTVYVGSHSRDLFALSTEDGQVQSRTRLGGIVGASPTVGTDRVYVGSDDGIMYALRT